VIIAFPCRDVVVSLSAYLYTPKGEREKKGLGSPHGYTNIYLKKKKKKKEKKRKEKKQAAEFPVFFSVAQLLVDGLVTRWSDDLGRGWVRQQLDCGR
jgi:hypothetical protein